MGEILITCKLCYRWLVVKKTSLMSVKKLKNSMEQGFSNVHLQAQIPQHQPRETLQWVWRWAKPHTLTETHNTHQENQGSEKSCREETCLPWLTLLFPKLHARNHFCSYLASTKTCWTHEALGKSCNRKGKITGKCSQQGIRPKLASFALRTCPQQTSSGLHSG